MTSSGVSGLLPAGVSEDSKESEELPSKRLCKSQGLPCEHARQDRAVLSDIGGGTLSEYEMMQYRGTNRDLYGPEAVFAK